LLQFHWILLSLLCWSCRMLIFLTEHFGIALASFSWLGWKKRSEWLVYPALSKIRHFGPVFPGACMKWSWEYFACFGNWNLTHHYRLIDLGVLLQVLELWKK
jgi:hypothetical protein